MKPTTVRARTGIPLRFLVPASCAMAVLLVALVGISRREEAAKPMTTTATSPDSSTVAKLAPLLRSSPASPPPPLSGDRHARRLQEIEQLCGRLCSYRDALETHDAAVKRRPNARWSRDFVDPDQYAWFNEMVRKDVPVDCKVLYSETAVALFDTPASDQSEWLPPDSMNAAYTMGGRIRIGIRKKETNALYLGADALQAEWSREKIEETKKAAARDEFKGNYGLIEAILLKNALLTLPTKGKRLLVVGSEIPWVEAMLLNGRAASVTTLEYGAIRSSHPQVTTYTPSVFAKEFLAGKLEPFDGIVSYSSLEHRYDLKISRGSPPPRLLREHLDEN